MDYGENLWIWIIHELEVTERDYKIDSSNLSSDNSLRTQVFREIAKNLL
jgi:hypothetical protein